MTAAAPEPLVSLRDVAAHLGVPVETFYRWRKRNRGPKGYPLGREVRFRMSEVEAWLADQREETP